jgi:hypothetical protein
VAAVFDRQTRLTEFLQANAEGADWDYAVSSASLTFGQVVRFDAPLLGSVADGKDTWLWAWANRHLQLPPANETLADAVRQLSERTGLGLFASADAVACQELLPEEVRDAAAHVFGVIVTGELGYDAYYTLPYEGGRGVAVIRDDRLRVPEPHPLLRISSVFSQAIGGYPIPDHRAAFVPYVESYGLRAAISGQTVHVLESGTEVMTAEFDEHNRLTRLAMTVPPSK